MNVVDILKRFEQVERRLSIIEQVQEPANERIPDLLYLMVELPELEMGGLSFNNKTVRSIFELKDGIYYCNNILFHSARNVINDNSSDILTLYLESNEVRTAFLKAYESQTIDTPRCSDISVFLPEVGLGKREYNGVKGSYWCKEKAGMSSFFCVSINGTDTTCDAAIALGVLPAFCIVM